MFTGSTGHTITVLLNVSIVMVLFVQLSLACSWNCLWAKKIIANNPIVLALWRYVCYLVWLIRNTFCQEKMDGFCTWDSQNVLNVPVKLFRLKSSLLPFLYCKRYICIHIFFSYITSHNKAVREQKEVMLAFCKCILWMTKELDFFFSFGAWIIRSAKVI